MSPAGADIPYGTLDLMVLKTLDVMSPLNGYAIARRIEQTRLGSARAQPGNDLPGASPPRTEGVDQERVGTSDNKRRARFYEITKNGKKQLAAETESWERTWRS